MAVTTDEKLKAKRYVEENCQNLPTTRKIPHWSVLLDAKYCDMFLGVGQGKFPGGTGHFSSESEAHKMRATKYTGNIFKTTKGTMVYFGSEQDPYFNIIIGRELLAPEKLLKGFCVGRKDHDWFKGEGWQQRFWDNMFKDAGTKGFGKGITDLTTGVAFNNYRTYLEKIDNTTFETGTVIKLTWSSTNMITWQKVAKDLGTFLNNSAVKGVLVGAMGFLGVPPDVAMGIIDTVANICNAVANGQEINYADLIKTAGPIMPQFMKPYMNNVSSLYAVYNNPTFENMKACADTLGVNFNSVKNIIGSPLANVNPSELLNSIKPGFKLEDANKMLSGLKSLNIAEFGAKNGVNLTQYYEKIESIKGDIDNPLKNPLIQNITTNTLGTQVNSLIPNVDVIIQSVINSKAKITQEEHRNLINIATGQQNLDTVLPDMSMSSLLLQAVNNAKNGKPYLLPAEIPDEFRKCTAMYITAETGVPVLDKPPVKENKDNKPNPNSGKKNKAKKVKRKEYR